MNIGLSREGEFFVRKIEIFASAKINLILDVLGKRDDGYHQVEMIMQSIGLHDILRFQELTGDRIEISVNHPAVPNNQDNLAYQAAKILKERAGISSGIKIHLEKNIPIAAGLAGGSADAAGVLIGLNQFWDLGFSQQELLKLGASLGADVPFCIMGGTVLAEGIGTELTPLSPLPKMDLVLVTPKIAISTKEIYGRYTKELITKRPDLSVMLEAIKAKDLRQVKNQMVNVLEEVTWHYYPLIRQTKQLMEKAGLKAILMSGSGPTLFAFVDSPREAETYVQRLQRQIDGQIVKTCTNSHY